MCSLQRLAGYPTLNPISAPNLKLIMDGIKAQLAKPINQVALMTLQILHEIYHIVNFNIEFEFCVYTAMLAGFYCVLCSSNLVPLSTEKFNPKEQLTRWHVGLDEKDLEVAIILIEWSKNNQNCKKELWVLPRRATDEKVCLVRTFKKYFEKVKVPECAPCFSYHNEQEVIKALMYA